MLTQRLQPLYFRTIRAQHTYCTSLDHLACRLRRLIKTHLCSNGEPSVRLRDGLNELSASLHILSVNLDAVVFRDTWRAVAIAVMRLLYNEVATEAQFSPEVSALACPQYKLFPAAHFDSSSHVLEDDAIGCHVYFHGLLSLPFRDMLGGVQGAQQLQTDYSALVAVFQPYTMRPAAHLRELSEACTLLNLSSDRAAALTQGLASMQQVDAIAQLKNIGVSRLTPEQAQCVLDRRLDKVPASNAPGWQ